MVRSRTNMLALFSAVTGMMTAIAAVWAPARIPAEGVPIANRQLVCYRRGFDAEVALVAPAPAFFGISNESVEVVASEAARVNAVNSGWGGANYWLKIPGFSFSLWWVMGLAVMVGVVARRRALAMGRGFPVS